MFLARINTAVLALFVFSSTAYAADYVYQTNGDPWGNTTNDDAMSAAFGAANWSKSTYNTADFSSAKFVFLDGSDFTSNDLSSFIAGNQVFLENYVFNGGHLFINSAPNVGSSFSMGFGVTLNYAAYSWNATVNAAGVAAGLTDGGITTNYTGNYFSHATVSGPLTSLIDGDLGSVFGVMNWGSGFVAFGGQTTTNFHYPNSDAQVLLANELHYVAAVPEPETYAMLLAGLGLLGFMARCRKESAI